LFLHQRRQVVRPQQAIAMTTPAPAAIEPEIGLAQVTSNPPGATIYLDGRKLDKVTPATLDRLEADREHELLFQMKNRSEATERFTLGPREVKKTAVTLAAIAAPAAPASEPARPKIALEGDGMFVLATNPWVSVSIDGVPRGETPLRLRLKAGHHKVELAN